MSAAGDQPLQPPERASRTLKDLALVITGKLLAVGALLACSVIAARFAGAAEFGHYSAAIAIVLLIDAIFGSPLDYAAVRFGALYENEPERTHRFQSATFRIKIVVGVVFLSACAIASAPLARIFFDDPSRRSLVYITLGSAMLLLLIRGTSAYLQIGKRFKLYSMFDMVQAVARLVFLGGAVYLGATSAEPLVGVFGASALALFVIFLIAVRQPYLTAKWPEKRYSKDILCFITATAGIITLGTITGRADIPILSVYADAETVGVYAVAAQLSMLAMMLASYACVVFQPRVLSYARQGRLGVLIKGNVIAAVILGALAVPVAVWVLPVVVPAIFGAEYTGAVPILRILLIGTVLDILFMPVLMTFALQVRPKRALLGELVITLGFFACVPLIANGGGGGVFALAWIMTGVRVAKMALYAAITFTSMHGELPEARDAEPSA